MRYNIQNIPGKGRVLWLDDERTQIGVALDFGIRIVHLSCVGLENLFYEQPLDRSDGFTTQAGWCLYGGHRICLAPESVDSYSPDNLPIRYEICSDGVFLEQEVDSLLRVRKQMQITFLCDGGVRIAQSIVNVSDQPITGAAWGVNTLDAGGVARVSFGYSRTGAYNPERVVSLWSDTNLHDPRVTFSKAELTARHLPCQDYFKIGLYSNPGKAIFENKGQRFTLLFDSREMSLYPDNGCNFELYMCAHFMELESLGITTEILPGQSTAHVETWYLEKCN